jgi:signal transduction histidine kinase/ActR/RegA family two-component response regulator
VTLQQRLEHAVAIVEALLDAAHPRALAALDALAPTAVFAYPTAEPRTTNVAWRALVAGPLPEVLRNAIAAVAKHAAPIHIPEVAVAGDHRPAFCAVTVSRRRDVQIVVCEDITDEVVARTLGVAASALVWSAPVDGIADYYSLAWRVETGDARWYEAFSPNDMSRCQHAIDAALRTGAAPEVDVRLRDAAGAENWHRVRFVVEDGRWYATAVKCRLAREAEAERDELIARLQLARSDALQANRLKDQFLARVSHELRAPLTTMQLWEKVLRDEDASPEVRTRALDAIHHGVTSQARIVGDLLDVARATAGKLFVDMRPIKLEPVIVAAIAAIAPTAAARSITIDRRSARVASHILGDAQRLLQVFGNLLSNAVKFSQPGGRVTVGTFRRGRAITIEVVDTGLGISPQFLPHLFEPFSQVSDSLRQHEGFGLGLAIAHQLVDLHHGTLEAYSAGLGHGAKFTVTLPIAQGQFVGERDPGLRMRALDNVSVLLVDDDRRVLEALAMLLDRAGADVATADSAQAARGSIASHAPGVIVCDIAMPGEDGYQLIGGLRAHACAIPAIALTAHASETDAQRALAAGFDLHLAKPVDFERLVNAIHDMVARPTEV